MKRELKVRLLLLVLLFSFFSALGIQRLHERSRLSRLNSATTVSMEFRDHILNDDMTKMLHKSDNPGKAAGLYLLESKFSYRKFEYPYTEETVKKLYEKWAVKEEWIPYQKACNAIWNDLMYFPVPESADNPALTVTYGDSWMSERNNGGKRGHEGTDIMADQNERGVYPVISMTDGVVTSMGWLPKGGWRVGITAPEGGYFYYAHLDSYSNIREGDTVRAGDILGYMGDGGYGKEGAKGKFPVHLHVGIYLYEDGREISINPYWILRYLEKRKLKYAFS